MHPQTFIFTWRHHNNQCYKHAQLVKLCKYGNQQDKIHLHSATASEWSASAATKHWLQYVMVKRKTRTVSRQEKQQQQEKHLNTLLILLTG